MNAIDSSQQRARLLEQEVDRIRVWLSAFEAPRSATVGVSPSGETLWVRHFPLPDRMGLDDIHLAMIVNRFPVEPPKGIYLLSSPQTERVVTRLRHAFNVFHGLGFHGAPAMPGFEWICVGYLHGWRYDVARPTRGDNIQKMLLEFWRLLENEVAR